MRIVTLTLNPALDKSASVDQVVPERKLRCGQPRFDPGGGGLNVARAVKILGGEARALWTKGGHSGEMMHRLLDDEEVPHSPIPIADMTRENLIVYENVTGLQYRFGMPGPILTEADARACLEAVARLDADAEFLVISGSLPPGVPDDFCAAIARCAPAGCKVVLDTSGEGLRRGLECPMYLIKPNLRELGQLAGEEIHEDRDIVRAARAVIDAGRAEVVFVSIGRGGALLVTREQVEHVRAPTVPIRSKVGAGDSTVAGFVLSLSLGRALREAARFAVAAGAAAVMTEGTTLCRREDTERLYAEMAG
ncbi:MAG: 1-phosphofructokinase family hexose kinase [Planctomycetaceae bacterium]